MADISGQILSLSRRSSADQAVVLSTEASGGSTGSFLSTTTVSPGSGNIETHTVSEDKGAPPSADETSSPRVGERFFTLSQSYHIIFNGHITGRRKPIGCFVSCPYTARSSGFSKSFPSTSSDRATLYTKFL